MITYFEHYPHYMGTMSATIQFTQKQFDKMIELAKATIKENKSGEDETVYEQLEEFVDGLVEKKNADQYALVTALLNYFDSPRRPSSITAALKKKGVWSGEWEEGSHAFATTKRAARKAVEKIEAKHALDD